MASSSRRPFQECALVFLVVVAAGGVVAFRGEQQPQKHRRSFLSSPLRSTRVVVPLPNWRSVSFKLFPLSRNNRPKTHAAAVEPRQPPTHNNAVALSLPRREKWARLRALVGPDVPLLGLGVAFLVLAALSDVAVPHFQSQAITAIVGAAPTSPNHAIVGLLLASASAAVFSGLRGATFWLAGTRVVARLRESMFSNVVRQELAFFDATKRGILTSRLSSDASKVADVVSFNVNIILRQSIQALGGVTYLFWLDASLASVAVAWMAVAAVLTHYYGAFARRCSRRTQDALGRANAVADEAIENIRVVRSFVADETVVRDYARAVASATYLQRRHGIGYGLSRAAIGLAKAASIVTILAVGDQRRALGLIEADALVSFVFFAAFVNSAAFDVGDQLAKVEEALGAGAAAFDLATREPVWRGESPPAATLLKKHHAVPQLKQQEDQTTFGSSSASDVSEETVQPPKAGKVELRNVTLFYPARPSRPVLRDVNIVVEPGEKVALVGESGSGKSSVTRLLLRHYEASDGAVTLDGRDVVDLSQEEIARKIAYVEQEPRLFDRSIADNIKLGLDSDDPLAAPDRVTDAARRAGVLEFADKLPDKLDARVGAAGSFASGGQRQRVAIARALLRRPDLVVLDEASSALDANSERAVQSALDALNCSVLAVAHRLATVKAADRIYVLKNGTVVEQGTHAELQRLNGEYAAMVRLQSLAAGEGTEPPFFVVDDQLVNVNVGLSPDLADATSSSSEISAGLAAAPATSTTTLAALSDDDDDDYASSDTPATADAASPTDASTAVVATNNDNNNNSTATPVGDEVGLVDHPAREEHDLVRHERG